MLQIIPQLKIYVCCEVVDFRRGIDGLCAICRQKLGMDPFSGALFLFRNRAKTGFKMIIYDGQGFWLMYKRLSKGKIKWWPTATDQPMTSLAAKQLQTLIWNGNPMEAQFAPDWRSIQ